MILYHCKIKKFSFQVDRKTSPAMMFDITKEVTMSLIISFVVIILLGSIAFYLYLYRSDRLNPEKQAQENYKKRIMDRYR